MYFFPRLFLRYSKVTPLLHPKTKTEKGHSLGTGKKWQHLAKCQLCIGNILGGMMPLHKNAAAKMPNLFTFICSNVQNLLFSWIVPTVFTFFFEHFENDTISASGPPLISLIEDCKHSWIWINVFESANLLLAALLMAKEQQKKVTVGAQMSKARHLKPCGVWHTHTQKKKGQFLEQRGNLWWGSTCA